MHLPVSRGTAVREYEISSSGWIAAVRYVRWRAGSLRPCTFASKKYRVLWARGDREVLFGRGRFYLFDGDALSDPSASAQRLADVISVAARHLGVPESLLVDAMPDGRRTVEIVGRG
jgi:hypothetical protein